METNYKEGNLIVITSHKDWNVYIELDTQGRPTQLLREYALIQLPPGFHNSFVSLEQELGLITRVDRNKLDQPVGYRVQIGQGTWFFKSVLADKYFELVGGSMNGSRKDRYVQDP